MILPLILAVLVQDPRPEVPGAPTGASEPAANAPAVPQAIAPPDMAFSSESVTFFETKVRPVLADNCFQCHGPDKQWASLRLDTREMLLRGGDSGPAIVPGNAAQSLLLKAIRQSDDSLQMPPEGKLTDQQIADIEQWLADGAAFPAAAPLTIQARAADHWAFQPISPQPVPDVQNSAWPNNAVDRFILAALEEAGVAPAPTADKWTLIRRVTFDLTGLPPTSSEIEAFLADASPDAYEKLVDRLLASPAFGERYGRRWLDVARYADSNGLDENIAHGNAWRYRDYVVRSFNQDKPFDRFVIEQLAGDLLPFSTQSELHELLTATGFLSIGPKVLAESDQDKMRMDIVDEQVDTVGRAFLGLTLGCARCHDHKFDPIQTAEYYALAGIFKSTRTMDTYTKVARWHEHLLPSEEARALQTAYDAQLKEKQAELDALTNQAVETAKAALPEGAAPPAEWEPLFPEATRTQLAALKAELEKLKTNPPELPAAMGVAEDQVIDVPVHIRGNPLKLGQVVPRAVPAAIAGPGVPVFSPAQSGRLQLATWLVNPQNPLFARVLVNRFWRWHFGSGLVRSTDNFGLLGEAPIHPELLDWLARHLTESNGSTKQVVRLLVTSQTYQQSSQAPPESLTLDPDNRLYSRAELRRLEAEEYRDSLLAISGTLQRQFGGTQMKVKNRGYLFDHTSIDTTDYRSDRRSLYLPVIRNHVYDLFQLMDFPNPGVSEGNRVATTVAPQSLLMLNSPFVLEAADHFADDLLALPMDDAARLAEARLRTFGRPISDAERAADLDFLNQSQSLLAAQGTSPAECRRQSWSMLCQALLAANEFLYVR